MKTCYYCGGDLEEKRVTIPRQRQGKLIIIEDVPAEVCTQCGEKFFGPEATLVMNRMLEAKPVPGEKTVNVPIRPFAHKGLKPAET